MSSRIVFGCERSGLGATLRTQLLGGYDGFGLWRILIENVAGASEHLMVQVHEAMHHELQTSTVWGNLTALSAALANAGHRPAALYEVFDHGVEHSTAVHELYATFMADALGANRFSEDPLADNPTYAEYRRRANTLIPDLGEELASVRISAVAAVLRCCMQHAGLADLISTLDFATLTASELKAAAASGPDERLQALEAASVEGDAWHSLLTDLKAQDPGHQQRILDEHRSTTLEDMPALEAQWKFERDIVQRRCYEFAMSVLAELGHPTLGWESLHRLTAALAAAAANVEPSLAEVIAVGDDRMLHSAGDLLEFGRQGIDLRQPLALEYIEASEALDLLDGFVVQAGTDREHVCALWASPAVINKQFRAELPIGKSAGYLFTRARGSDGQPLARIGALPLEMTPRQLADMIASRPLLLLTTLSTIVDDSARAVLETIEPVFVLLDLPIGWHVDHWVRQGAKVRIAVATVDREREIALIALVNDRAPMFRFFHIGGLLALGSLLERLRQRHDPALVSDDQAVLEADAGGFTLAVNHVLHTFHVLDQNGVA